jgi:hypothetical protein
MKTLSFVSKLSLLCAALAGCGSEEGRSPTAPPLPVPFVNAPCSEYDNMSNGSIDSVYQYTYDSAGFYTSIVGSAGDVTTVEYDANHFKLHTAFNADMDPVIEWEETYTRDPDGRTLTYETRDETGVLDSQMYTYDDQGRVVKATISTKSGDMVTMYSTDYVYTGDQLNPTSARLTYTGGSSSLVYTSSSDQRTVHVDTDDGEDGTIDRTRDYVYDENRRILTNVGRTQGMITDRAAATYSKRGAQKTYNWSNNDTSMPDDWSYVAMFTDDMLTQHETTSPSGEFSTAIYRETYKTQCAAMATKPAPAKLPPVIDRPPTIAAP